MPAPRSGWVILSAFAILAVFGGMVGYAYNWGVSQFETPVILADSGPIKSQPESPGGLNVPNQDVAVLTDGAPDPANPQVERLLPPPETPPPPQTERMEAEAITEPEALAPAGPPLETAPGPAEKMPPEAESPLASAPQIAAATPAATPAPPAASLSAPSETPAPQVAALPPATAPAGPYVVQLAALKSQDGARPAWGACRRPIRRS